MNKKGYLHSHESITSNGIGNYHYQQDFASLIIKRREMPYVN